MVRKWHGLTEAIGGWRGGDAAIWWGFVDEGGKSLKLFRIDIAEPLTHQVQCPSLLQSFKGNKVLVRCDVNVPLDGKKITDDTPLIHPHYWIPQREGSHRNCLLSLGTPLGWTRGQVLPMTMCRAHEWVSLPLTALETKLPLWLILPLREMSSCLRTLQGRDQERGRIRSKACCQSKFSSL